MKSIAEMATRRRGRDAIRVAAVAAFLALGAVWAPAAAGGSIVDPSTLTPVPPDIYTCTLDGANTICRASFETFVENGDDGAVCGDEHLYETIHVVESATRWYADGLLVRKLLRVDLRGTFSLSPTGAAPTAAVHAHQQESFVYPVPGDIDSEIGTVTGLIVKVGGSTAQGFGAQVQAAGRIDANGDLHGLNHDIPGVDEALCDLLAP
jgi:hypothetical protein